MRTEPWPVGLRMLLLTDKGVAAATGTIASPEAVVTPRSMAEARRPFFPDIALWHWQHVFVDAPPDGVEPAQDWPVHLMTPLASDPDKGREETPEERLLSAIIDAD